MDRTVTNVANYSSDTKELVVSGLQGVNNYLAMINNRLEVLLLTDLPEYVKTDLIKAYQAEQEASLIIQNLKVLCQTSS
jgi:hypothetical protein